MEPSSERLNLVTSPPSTIATFSNSGLLSLPADIIKHIILTTEKKCFGLRIVWPCVCRTFRRLSHASIRLDFTLNDIFTNSFRLYDPDCLSTQAKVTKTAWLSLMGLATQEGWLSILEWARSRGVHLTDPIVFDDCTGKRFYQLNQACLINAAQFGQLQVLEWAVAVENGPYLRPLHSDLCRVAAAQGHVKVIQWAEAKGLTVTFTGPSVELLEVAAQNGHLEMLQWGSRKREGGIPPNVCTLAAMGGHLAVLQWAVENGAYLCEDQCIRAAAENGHLKVLRWIESKRDENIPGGCWPL